MGRVRNLVVLFVSLIASFCVSYAADSEMQVTRVDMSVSVDEYGTAHVNEVWNLSVSSGTEIYKRIINLGGSKISNLSVENETGKKYTPMSPWDSSKSRLEKFTSCGIRESVNGDTVIYWGIGDYGDRAYTLTYEISDFIKACEDGKYVQSTLLYTDDALKPQTVHVELKMPYSINGLNDLSTYGGDYNYTIQDTLSIESHDGQASYLTIVMRIPKENEQAIQTNILTNKTWDDIYNEAKLGGGLGISKDKVSLQQIVMIAVLGIVILILILKVISEIHIRKRIRNPLGLPIKFIYDNKTSPSNIPCIEQANSENMLEHGEEQTDIYEIFVVGVQYGIVKSSNSLLSALLMKWIINTNIEIYPYEDSFKLYFKSEPDGLSFETDLYNNLNSINSQEYVTAKEFSEWFKGWTANYSIWLEEVMRSTMRLLQDKGYCNTVTASKRVQKRITFIEYKVTNEMLKYALKIQRFKKFIRSGLSDDILKSSDIGKYIIYAQLFGCTNTLYDNIKNRYNGVDIDKVNETLILLNKLMSIIKIRLKASKS